MNELLPVSTNLQATLLVGAILVIDDDWGIREALTDLLGEITNRLVYTARNGREGVELMRQKHHLICLILLDMNMPLMNGEQTYAKLQEIAPKTKVIVSTSLSQTEVFQRFAPHPSPPILHKPYHVDVLSTMVRLALGMM